MKTSPSETEHKPFAPQLALFLVSAIGVGLVALRVALSGRGQQLYLVWNLFLAWLPLLLAWRVQKLEQRGEARGWSFWATASAWLLFFPNAPYIFTDLIHLTYRTRGHVWTDMTLILLFSMTGFLLGFLSLYLMQSLVARRFGWLAGWTFVAAVAGLSSFGIYLGRFLRWNSWDVLLNPVGLLRDVGDLAAHPSVHVRPVIFQLLFAVFVFLAYLMLYALTHLRPHQGGAVLPRSPDFSQNERGDVLAVGKTVTGSIASHLVGEISAARQRRPTLGSAADLLRQS